ncbi:MAG: cation diffusion facilitator family transporter [Arenicellales bacterium]|nr:cation diffusion facilitator family transporter [Arenicellales bacterium]
MQPSRPIGISKSQRYKETKRATLVGAVVDLSLGVTKIVVGKLAYSQSLIADGVHSLSDLATDALVVWAAKEAHREPDADHPYGHQRIETVATISLGLLLAVVAVAIGFNAISGVIEQVPLHTPTFWALVVAALSVLSKEAIYQYTMRVADRIQSDLLRSNAWHSRSDALSSIVVIIGVGGSMLGLVYLDAIAAVIVAVMIVYVALKMIWQGVTELIDTGIDADQLSAIRDTALQTEGVTDIHDLRTRRMGSDIYLDGHVLVEPRLSVSEGHRIGDAVYNDLKKNFENLADVTIHIDAEDDEKYQQSSHLPLRSELTSRLKKYWQDIPESKNISRIVLHYLSGQLQIEVWIPMDQLETLDDGDRIKRALREACNHDQQIETVEVLFQ